MFDNTLYVDTTNAVVMGSRNNLKLPAGTTLERPAIPANGMIRYNENTGDVEVYQGSSWRALRYKESGAITQQTVGVGDGENVYFGPLNPAPPAVAQSGYSWSGRNLLVVVENVLQLHNTNYQIVQNPVLVSESYFPSTSIVATPGDTRLYFNTGLPITGTSGNGTTVTISFLTQDVAPFATGSTITVEGIIPYEYNGTWTVTGCTDSTVSYAHTATGSMTTEGTVTGADVEYPNVSLAVAALSGSVSILPGTTVTSYSTNGVTGALIYVDLDTPLAGPISADTQIQIDTVPAVGSGYYLEFSSPVPPGKTVTVLHGFDQ